jgi:DNA polymerase III subunit beta
MKASYDREGLLAAVQVVSSVVPSRTPKPILQNIKVTTTKDKCVLTATDLDSVGIRLEVRGVQVEEPGDALLPTSRLLSILRECEDQELRLEADASSSFIRGEHNEFELPGDDPLQYPEVPGFDGDDYHQVQASVLKTMIDRTIFAAATEHARFALTGILWEVTAQKVRLVATDGRRLAVADGIGVMHGKHDSSGQTPVVPTKVMQLLERNLLDPEEPVFASLRANEALFKTTKAEIYGRLVEGRYPPYRDVFPKKAGFKTKLTVAPFMSAVRQAAILTDEESRGVDFSFAKGKLTLKAKVADKGRAKVEMPVEFEGKGADVTFDPKFIIEMLRVLNEDAELTLELGDATSAALFKAGDDYSYIVMPLAREGR